MILPVEMSWLSFGVSIVALVIAYRSSRFAQRSWGETHRPLVSVRVTTHAGGNEGFALKLLVENTGSRPATNISLSVDDAALNAAFAASATEELRTGIRACFSAIHAIPVLANGRHTSNEFGFVSLGTISRSDWNLGSRIPVLVSYGNLDTSREYRHRVTLTIADDRGFAGAYWSEIDPTSSKSS